MKEEQRALSEHAGKNDIASEVSNIQFEKAGMQCHVNNDIEATGTYNISEEVDAFVNDGIQHQSNSIEQSTSNEHGCKNDRTSTVTTIQVEE